MLTGLVTILPVVLTLYLLYWLAVTAESVLGGMIKLVLPESVYWPGMGLIAGLLVVFVSGVLMHAYVVQRIFARVEQLFYHMPLIKSVYGAIRDFFNYFSPTSKKEFEQVVAVSIGSTGMQAIGFVTQAIPEQLPEGLREKDKILVYMPMSYMIGGYAVLMPRSAVRPLDMSMEEAMRFILTAGVTSGVTTASAGAEKTSEGNTAHN
jgi:uncharacterized membrane protein